MKPPVILVIRIDDVFSSLLWEAGCEVLNLELIKTVPTSDLSDLHKVFDQIEDYDGLFFTSPAAAEVFVEQSAAKGQKFTGRTYALGERAKTILENSGFEVTQPEKANTAEELIASFAETEFAGKRLLFVRGDKSLQTIPQHLSAKATVDEVIVYETKEIRPDEPVLGTMTERLSRGEVDWICFFSPSGVKGFRKLFASEIIGNLKTAAVGETTAREARESNFNVEYVSQRPAAEDFAAGLIEFIKDIE